MIFISIFLRIRSHDVKAALEFIGPHLAGILVRIMPSVSQLSEVLQKLVLYRSQCDDHIVAKQTSFA